MLPSWFGLAVALTLSADVVPAALLACASVKKNAERLACYDRTIERLSSDSSAGAAERSAEAMFGATAPASNVERQELASVNARVTALRHDSGGALLIALTVLSVTVVARILAREPART